MTENLLWDGANLLQTMGISDTSWQSEEQSMSVTLPGFSQETLEPWRSFASGIEPSDILELGRGCILLLGVSRCGGHLQKWGGGAK